MNSIAFFEVFAWNSTTGLFDTWLGTATRTAIAQLGQQVQVGGLVGYEVADRFPSGWACKAKL
jgi:hypothetical protein